MEEDATPAGLAALAIGIARFDRYRLIAALATILCAIVRPWLRVGPVMIVPTLAAIAVALTLQIAILKKRRRDAEALLANDRG